MAAVALLAHAQHRARDGREPFALGGRVVFGLPLTEGDRREGEVAARAGNGVELEFERLEALFEFAHGFPHGEFAGDVVGDAHLTEFLKGRRFALQNVGEQNLVEFGEREAAELLRGRDERDVADHLQGRENGLRFRIFDVRHFKAALQHRADVEETAVDAAEDHVAQVVNVDVAALDQFLFEAREIELLVEALREVALDERTLRRDEGTVVVGVFTVAEAQDVVRVLAELFEGLGVGRLVVAVFGVGFAHFLHLKEGERGDHEFVEFRHGHAVAVFNAAIDFARDGVERRLRHDLVAAKGRLAHGVGDFRRVVVFNRFVLLDNLYTGFRWHGSPSFSML